MHKGPTFTGLWERWLIGSLIPGLEPQPFCFYSSCVSEKNQLIVKIVCLFHFHWLEVDWHSSWVNFQDCDAISVMKAGKLRFSNPNKYWVESSQKRVSIVLNCMLSVNKINQSLQALIFTCLSVFLPYYDS